MVEVVVEVGVGLDETERDTLAELEVRLALAPAVDLEALGQPGQRASRSLTRSATCSSAPRSRGPSAAKSVSFPRRASAPTSVKASVRSTTCIPRCAMAKPATASRSASQ